MEAPRRHVWVEGSFASAGFYVSICLRRQQGVEQSILKRKHEPPQAPEPPPLHKCSHVLPREQDAERHRLERAPRSRTCSERLSQLEGGSGDSQAGGGLGDSQLGRGGRGTHRQGGGGRALRRCDSEGKLQPLSFSYKEARAQGQMLPLIPIDHQCQCH